MERSRNGAQMSHEENGGVNRLHRGDRVLMRGGR